MLIKLFWFVSVAVVDVILFYVDVFYVYVDVPILLFEIIASFFLNISFLCILFQVSTRRSFFFFFLFYNARFSIFVFSSTITIQYIMVGIYNGKSLN